jgi:hypothetical protein
MFRCDNPPEFDRESSVEQTRVLTLQMAGKPSERRLYAQILAVFGAPHNRRTTIVDLEQVTLRMLLLDEVHNILAGALPRVAGRAE